MGGRHCVNGPYSGSRGGIGTEEGSQRSIYMYKMKNPPTMEEILEEFKLDWPIRPADEIPDLAQGKQFRFANRALNKYVLEFAEEDNDGKVEFDYVKQTPWGGKCIDKRGRQYYLEPRYKLGIGHLTGNKIYFQTPDGEDCFGGTVELLTAKAKLIRGRSKSYDQMRILPLEHSERKSLSSFCYDFIYGNNALPWQKVDATMRLEPSIRDDMVNLRDCEDIEGFEEKVGLRQP